MYLSPERALASDPVSDHLYFGRLTDFYKLSSDQMPHVLKTWELEGDRVSTAKWKLPLQRARIWAFIVPSGQIVAALTVDVTAPLSESPPLLEDTYYANLTIDGTSLEQWIYSQFASEGFCAPGSNNEFAQERHQLVFSTISDSEQPPDQDQVQRVIYRAKLPARPESLSFLTPAELNRRPNNVAAVGPYVSLLSGHQDYVENSALVSAVLGIGSAARLRQVRERAYSCVRTFRNSSELVTVKERRVALEEIAELLGDLELELSFSVESTADLGMLIQAMRVESFHNALCESISLNSRAATTGRMLSRLRNAITDELTNLTSSEDRAEDARRLRTAIAVTMVSTIGGTLAVLFGFFGVNASQVHEERSVFDACYLPIYVIVGTIVIGAVACYTVLARLATKREQHFRRKLLGRKEPW